MKKRNEILNDYDGFVDKFKPKKTTDDCYTPECVYNAVLDYVRSNYNLDGLDIVRPFYPGGDYENYPYSVNSIVIDNPPFSIISQIVRFYISKGIKFFLFAPHLTLLTSDIQCTALVVGATITYENGAKVRTSFLSNLFGNLRLVSEPSLYKKIQEVQKTSKKELPAYSYPDNIITVCRIQQLVEGGERYTLRMDECQHCRGLDAQKTIKKAIFGSGLLISDEKAAECKAAECKAAERKAAECKAAECKAAECKAAHAFELSERERCIVDSLRS